MSHCAENITLKFALEYRFRDLNLCPALIMTGMDWIDQSLPVPHGLDWIRIGAYESGLD